VEWTSYGKGQTHNYLDPAVKAGLVYKINGRNLLSLNGMFKTQAPLPYDAYMAPRIIDEYLPGLNDKWYPNKNSTMIAALDLNFVFSFPKINGRVSVFYDEYLNDLQQTAYYNDSYGTFVHHNIVGANKRNYGAEAGVSYNVWKNLTLSLAGTWMNYRYTNNPMGYIRTENGYVEAGYPDHEPVKIKNFHVGGSPEVVGTLGVQYFWNYFWFEAHVNVAGSSYLDPSYIQRTDYITKQLKSACETAGLSTAEKQRTLQAYTEQTRLDDWSKAAWKNNTMPLTLDLSVSKLFYFKGGKQLNINLSLVNVTNNTGIKTGGFEQGRIPTKVSQGITSFDLDNINKFPAKYYFMQGFNFFLNVAFKF
jgi:outer membrane receptor protein involved in Fe transport